MSLPPFRPEDFDEACETCLAPPGQLCRPWCDTGYTADDHRAQAERHMDRPDDQPARHKRTAPKDGPR
ncbi:hypothetical protein [Streptomyces hokutonensis]|uniref:hypothetical protein n=1 Tax=Streptomyces hokutonensis TaxID=1306990 RepID=UPI00037890E9|nr:hypothetical protein [Streptomyces hokutonensis]